MREPNDLWCLCSTFVQGIVRVGYSPSLVLVLTLGDTHKFAPLLPEINFYYCSMHEVANVVY